MNEDLSFQPFPFDFDFVYSDPLDGLVPFNDPGFPRFWENVDDIIGGGLDFVGKLGELFKELWGTIWSGVGGAVRWAWNRTDDAIDWLAGRVDFAKDSVLRVVNWWFDWVWRSAGDSLGWFTGGVAGGFRWVWKQAEHWGGVSRDAAFDTGNWLWDAARGPWGLFTGGIGGGFRWLWDQLGKAKTDLIGWIAMYADWLWDTARDPWGLFTGGFTGGFRWLWQQVGGAKDTILQTVDWWFDWLWSKAGNAYFGITGGLTGGFVWVRDQVLPRIAGAAENIVGGILGGFDKLGKILMAPLEFLGGLIVDALKWLVEGAFEPMVDFVGHKLAIPGKMITGQYATVEAFVDDIMDPPPLKNIVMVLGWVALAIPSLIMGMFPVCQPAMANLIHNANVTWRPRLLTEGDIIEARVRDIPISGGYEKHLARWGYRDEDIGALFALSERLPSPADLVRFGVREVFTPEIAERFGQFEDLPGDFVLAMLKLGYAPDTSRNYWGAHWDLPSASQGFEMHRRGVIDTDDLKLLLRALDVMPYWRDRLVQISYSPITRVDLRRLYQKGFITEERLERGYRELGYDAENARALTDWTKTAYPRAGEGPPEDLRELTLSIVKQSYVRRLIDRQEAMDRLMALDYVEEDADLTVAIWDFDLAWNPSLRFEVDFKNLSQATITNAYRRGVFDFNRAAVELVEAGYTQDDAELLLQLEDLKLQQELSDMEIDLVVQEARAQDITLAEAETRLLGLGLEPARVTFLVRREELRRMTKTRTLTVSQMARAYREGIFTEDVFLQKVEAQGYTVDDAAVLLGLEGQVEQAKRQLSRSEVERLLRRGEITHDDALGRLTALGYLPEDAELVVGSVERQLERGLVERLLEQAILTRAEALDRLVKVGFSSADAELIVRSREQKMAEKAAQPEPEETPSRELSRTLVEKFLREGLLDRQQALERLVKGGFTPSDAELIVLSVELKLAQEGAEA